MEEDLRKKKKTNTKKIILGSIIGILIGSLLSVSYAFFTYNRTGLNNKLIVGDIYMRYKETSQSINFTNAMPSSTYVANQYFEFDIVGKNTTTNKDIIYDIVLNHGDAHPTRTTRIKDELLRFRLVKVVENETTHEEEEQEIFNDRSYSSIVNTRIHKEIIPRNTTNEITITYRLYAWIANETVIGNGETADYSNQEWEDVFASIKVNVTGDFLDKKVQGVLYDIVKTGAQSDTGIRFYEVNGTDNGNGKFVRSTTTSDQYPIYYYRGNVDNNNVVFANKCWKIVRTTDTGGTKMIYNGEVNSMYEYSNISKNEYIDYDTSTSTVDFVFNETEEEWTGQSNGSSSKWNLKFKLNEGHYRINISSQSFSKPYFKKNNQNLIPDGQPQSSYVFDFDALSFDTFEFNYESNIPFTYSIIINISKGNKVSDYSCNNIGTATTIGEQAFNQNYNSPAYVGYNYGKVYEYLFGSKSGTYGNSVTYGNGKYTLVNTNSELDSNHHYICDDENCTKLRYYYYNDYYIVLENGMIVDDALKEMLSESRDITKSLIHETINNWYSTNIKNSYGRFVEDTNWCNDRSVRSLEGWNPNGGSLNPDLYFNAYNRYQNTTDTNGIKTTNTPILTCSNPNDRMSVANGKLNNPVALLTCDEANLTGQIFATANTSNYLNNGSNYWLLSPAFLTNNDARVGKMSNSGIYNDYVSVTNGVRPALSLKHGTLVYDGDGTVANPYIVGTPRT